QGSLNKSRTQNFVENNSESPIFLSILKDSTNTEDFNIHDISLDNAFTGINNGNFSLWFDDINIEDYDKNNTILVKDKKTIQSISDSCSDINSRDLLFCESETPSSLFCGSLSCENSKYYGDSDNVCLTKDGEGSIYFDVEDFELDNNKEQELPDSFEEHNNAESANMSESNKLRINNVEGKREKRLFDTFNEYIGTDKLYSENLDVGYDSETLCTTGH
uniref:TLDc domain-containing protein n=1 Tax=Strongyloides venezuelensis TaxID=75913 RepID=A0A0K0FSY3_STRVS